jgi:hypothetical protein
VTGSEFKFTVRLRKDGDNTITGIAAVASNVVPNAGNTPAGILTNILKVIWPVMEGL